MIPAPAAVARPTAAASTKVTSAPSRLAAYPHAAPTIPVPTTISRMKDHFLRTQCHAGQSGTIKRALPAAQLPGDRRVSDPSQQ
jgi:hypothetical protein